MSDRRVLYGRQFFPSLRRAGVRVGSPQAKAVLATGRALETAPVLPSPIDYETLVPPVKRVWVRRVPGRNLWIYYEAPRDTLVLLFVVTSPPVPLA